jgi:hypothetical protein
VSRPCRQLGSPVFEFVDGCGPAVRGSPQAGISEIAGQIFASDKAPGDCAVDVTLGQIRIDKWVRSAAGTDVSSFDSAILPSSAPRVN